MEHDKYVKHRKLNFLFNIKNQRKSLMKINKR